MKRNGLEIALMYICMHLHYTHGVHRSVLINYGSLKHVGRW